MKIRNKKIIWNKKIITIALSVLFLVIIGGVSYAYFAARVSGNDTAKDVQAYAGTMNLVYNGTFATSAEKMMPGDSHEIQFTVTNTGTLSTSYQVDMIDIINDFEKPEELVYSITSDNGGGQQEETEVPITNETLIPAVGIDPGVTQNYTLKLKFKETGADQNYNQNKTFSGKIQINSLENSNYLASRVLINQIRTDEVDYSTATPALKYQKVIKEDGFEGYMSSSMRGDKTIGDGYTFNSEDGMYYLTGVRTQATMDETSVGKYMCVGGVSSATSCYAIYKITEVENNSNEGDHNYVEFIKENVATSIQKDNNATVAKSYTFDDKKGLYTLIDKEENVTYSTDYIGYYTCNSSRNDGACAAIYKIKEVEDTTVTNTDRYSTKSLYHLYIDTEDEYAQTVTEPITVAKGYTFDQSTGTFTLTDTEEVETVTEEYIGYYTTFNSGNNNELNKIKRIEDNKVYVEWMYSDYPYYLLKKADYYYKKSDLYENESGLYKTEDDLGISYYYRGQENNNYVKFANQLWRIYRINGDGSIRLIRNSFFTDANSSTLNDSAFSSSSDDQKYVGYTYDNSAPNVQDGTNSTIKTYLENWYNNNSYIQANKDKIVTGIYCNDTTSITEEDGSISFGSKTRIENDSPSLKCPKTDKTYGGKYELKIGMISADEIAMAGLNGGNYTYNHLYLSSYNGSWLTMSPYQYSDNNSLVYKLYYSSLSSLSASTATKVRAVINLRKDIKFTSGDGTKDNPYIVE